MKDAEILKYDKQGMFGLIKGFPEQCRKAVGIAREHSLPGRFEGITSIVSAGMGGSAIGGDVIYNCFSGELAAPFSVVRDYDLPAFVDSGTFFIAASYSGNTEETLSLCRQAFARKARVIAVTSGGELEKLCLQNGAPVVKIPGGQPPRTAIGYMFFPMLVKLEQAGLINDKSAEIKNTITLMEDMSLRLSACGSAAEETAAQLHGSLPVIYGSAGITSCAAFRWRTQLNENSKMLASTALFPEMNHNEIVGWEHPPELMDRLPVVILRDSGDNERVKARIEITKSLIGGVAPSIREVWSEGRSLPERIFSLMYYGDFVSLYLAVLNGVDPTPVERIQTLKERLKLL